MNAVVFLFFGAVVLVLARPEHGLTDGHAERDHRLLEQELAAAVGDDGGRNKRERERAVFGAGALRSLGIRLKTRFVGRGCGNEGRGGGFTERVSSRTQANHNFAASTVERGR